MLLIKFNEISDIINELRKGMVTKHSVPVRSLQDDPGSVNVANLNTKTAIDLPFSLFSLSLSPLTL